MIDPKTYIVKKIDQVNNHTFSIEWGDGVKEYYRLSDLQRACPCANCVDEESGKRIIDPDTIQDDVSALSITNVGRYALRIQFSKNCSHGIFSFDKLRGKLNSCVG